MGASQVVTDALREWIVAQAQAGHSAESVLQAMRQSGWRDDVALEAMETTMQAHVATLPGRATVGDPPGPMLRDSRHVVRAHDRDVHVLVRLEQPCLAVFAQVLSAEECAELRALAQGRLSRSETVEVQSGGSEVNAARTSEGMFFERGETELIQRIEARLAALVDWPVDHGEGMQVLRYRPGAEYRPHFDYFDPAQAGSSAILRRGGQRVGTFVLYLNTPEEGGATVFPDAGVTVSPIEGHAVFFGYPRPDPATGTLHGGAPVVQGDKWVATKWLRQQRFD